MTGNHTPRDAALDKLAEVHRGWCTFCRGDALVCLNAQSGWCALRDYMVAMDAPVAQSSETATTTERDDKIFRPLNYAERLCKACGAIELARQGVRCTKCGECFQWSVPVRRDEAQASHVVTTVGPITQSTVTDDGAPKHPYPQTYPQASSVATPAENVLREELRRLKEWFRVRDRPGHHAQVIYIDGALDRANSAVSATLTREPNCGLCKAVLDTSGRCPNQWHHDSA